MLQAWPVAVFCVVLAFSILNLSGMSAALAPTPEPTTCTYTLTFRIFAGVGQIYFNGQWYTTGQQTTITGPCGASYTVSGSVGGGYYFFQWLSNAGSFGPVIPGSCNCQTSFTPTSSGSVIMIVGAQLIPWAGYVIEGSGVTYVTAHFRLPTSASPIPGGTNPQVVSIWSGIGGFFGNQYLWQAGIQIQCGWNHVIWWDVAYCGMVAWWENWPDPPQYECPSLFCGSFSSHLNWGDDVTITIEFDASNNNGRFLMVDNTHSAGWSGSFTLPHPPNTSSAEWIAECPGFAPPNPALNCPSFSTIGVVTPSSSLYSSTIYGPLARATSSATINGIRQTVAPGPISPGGFLIDYYG